MKGPFLIALDQGTSSCRAFALDQQGEVRAKRSMPLSPRRTAQGTSEYNAEELIRTQQTVLTGLLDEIGPQQVACLAVCSQRSTVVLWDKNTAKPLAPVLTWEDSRAQQEADLAPLSQTEVHQLTGLFKTPYFSAPKIAWCLKNYPAAQTAARQGNLLAGPVATFLIWKLTQGKIFATDPALAQRTLLWNIHTQAWSSKLCQAFGVPEDCLPCIQSPVGDYGTFEYKGAVIPIGVCAADQQAATVYQRLRAGQTHINYGTGAFVLHHTGEKALVLPGMLTSVAYTLEKQPPQFALEGPVFAAGSVLQWLQAQGLLTPGAHIDDVCQQAKQPVRFLPALGGLGAPYWDYRVSSVIDGLSPHTRPADFVAGALQGVAHLVADIADYLHAHEQTVQNVSASGGMAHIAYLLQTQANFLQIPVKVTADRENTVLGTSLLAARYLGWNTSAWQVKQRSIFPRQDALEVRSLRAEWKQWIQHIRNYANQ